jgi:hypothetical protein
MRMRGEQALGTRRVGLGQPQLRLRLRTIGGQPVDLGLERTRVDAKQHIALVHFGTFLKLDGVHISTHARPHVDGVDGLELAGEFGAVADRPHHGLGHGDFGQAAAWCCGLGLGAVAV